MQQARANKGYILEIYVPNINQYCSQISPVYQKFDFWLHNHTLPPICTLTKIKKDTYYSH